MPSLIRSRVSPLSQFSSTNAGLYSRIHLASTAVPPSFGARTFLTTSNSPKSTGSTRNFLNGLQATFSASVRKLFAPSGSSDKIRVIAGLNRFGPFTSFNPMFIWKLQTLYRPYLTMGISLVASLLYISSTLGTPDSAMRLIAVPTRIWSGEETRLISSSFIHTSFPHLLSLSGFFLAFSTAIEVAAGPVTLLAVLLSAAVIGNAASVCAPENSTKYVANCYFNSFLS